ncbi:hypothetical protein [Streptomyces cyaneofuscatus]|uniref:hypothetical protein n=1 Tax=Streptomyces cyaneofuscatus TaxID=66883 RepID=UPI0033BF5C23
MTSNTGRVAGRWAACAVLALGGVLGGAGQAGAAPAPAAATVNSFSFTSDADNPVGNGRTATLTEPEYEFLSSISDPSDYWLTVYHLDELYSVQFAPPRGEVLRKGTYKNAVRATWREGRQPGIDIAGERGCQEKFGSFTVHSIKVNADGRVTAIDVSFVQHCWTKDGPLFKGRLTYTE